jgi:ornithine cyclodeaminase/alanine dehydrogenase
VPIYLNENDVAEFLDMPTAIQALRDAFAARARGEGNVIPRTRWEFGERRLNVMGGGLQAQRRFAVKCYGSSAFHVLLYSEQDGLLAIIEANVLGQIRTGAASAVASEKMAKPGASKVALIGTGRQARTQALALKSAGLLREIAVYGRARDKLEAFCAKPGAQRAGHRRPLRRGGGGGRRHRHRRHQLGDAGRDGVLAQGRRACERYRGQRGQSPRDRSRDRAQGVAGRH